MRNVGTKDWGQGVESILSKISWLSHELLQQENWVLYSFAIEVSSSDQFLKLWKMYELCELCDEAWHNCYSSELHLWSHQKNKIYSSYYNTGIQITVFIVVFGIPGLIYMNFGLSKLRHNGGWINSTSRRRISWILEIILF